MMLEEEWQRIPIAQGLPWTTDEPECLVKPPVKKNTWPLDLKMHPDMRASEHVEFGQQIAAKLNLLEQYKAEKELEEHEEKRDRKELVPKTQPMPYFDRPFVPRRVHQEPNNPKRTQVSHPSA